jgi:hypothetical protein
MLVWVVVRVFSRERLGAAFTLQSLSGSFDYAPFSLVRKQFFEALRSGRQRVRVWHADGVISWAREQKSLDIL